MYSLSQAAKLSYVEGVVDPSIGVSGAATLRLGTKTVGEKINVGVLVKIEVSGGHVRVGVRTTLPASSAPLASDLKAFLLQL